MTNKPFQFLNKIVLNSKLNMEKIRINNHKYQITKNNQIINNILSNRINISQLIKKNYNHYNYPYRNFYSFSGGPPNGNDPEFIFLLLLGLTTYFYIIKKI